MKRTLLALLLLVLLGSALTACGSSSKKSTTTTTAAAGASGFQAAEAAYRACMAQNGVDLPANSFPGGGGRRTTTTNSNGGTAPANTGGTPPAGGGGQYGGGARPTTTLPAGVTEAQYQKAQQACASKLPQRGTGGPGGAGGANSTQFAAYLSCLNDHGVTVSTTGGAQALANVDRTTAAFQAAQTACQALMPQRPTSSSTTSSTTA